VRTVAICSDIDACIGFRLVGVESHHAVSEEELTLVLEELNIADIGIIAICSSFSQSPVSEIFQKKNPQILFAGF